MQQATAGGPDNISARIIREFCVELATPLADIINTSFSQSKVPKDWKRAIVIPIPKTNPPSIDRLRPISLTSHFAKIAEGFMAKWILQDISPKIDPNQFGNRKFLSTNHYLINMLHLLFQNADKPKATSSVIVTDFTKAFDRVDHTIAIRKLIDLGTRSAIIPWIADFLCSRQQCVRYHSTCSDWVSLHAGVPQGTKLGPIIFLAMVNDVNPSFQNSTTFKYVDDLSIVECRNYNQPSELQKSMDYLLTWCDHNHMKMNPPKCAQMNVCFLRVPQIYPAVSTGNHELATVKATKILGVIIQNDLKWDQNINNIIKRANSKIHMLRLLKRHGLPYDDLLTIYMCYIRPVIEYAAPVWNGGLTKNQITRLERVQKRVLRVIIGARYSTYDTVLDELKIESLSDRRKSLCLSFFQKTLLYTDQFKQYFPPENNTRTLRRKPQIPELRCKTKRMQNSPIPYLIRALNQSKR